MCVRDCTITDPTAERQPGHPTYHQECWRARRRRQMAQYRTDPEWVERTEAHRRNRQRNRTPEAAARARERNNQLNARIRAETLAAYGGKCACCGETEQAFLVIDHIDGGGNTHRREISGRHTTGGHNFYKWLKRNGWPTGYQALCANCNLAKERAGGCPHQRRS